MIWIKRIFAFALSIIIVSIIILLVVLALRCQTKQSGQLPFTDCDTMAVDHPIYEFEDASESQKIAEAVIAQIGTDSEQQCFGYNATYVIQVLTAEAGSDELLCHALATALFNECINLKGRQTPEQAIKTYKWCNPVDFISDAAMNGFIKVFINGDFMADVENATMFYNPTIMDSTPSHEQYKYVCTINDVRFFEE